MTAALGYQSRLKGVPMIRNLLFALAAVAVAALAVPGANAQQALPKVKLCSGPEGGNYQKAMIEIKKQATTLDVEVFETKGSWENLERLAAGQCDFAPVQADAVNVFKKKTGGDLKIDVVDYLYKEFVHLLCNREAKIDRVVDLYKNAPKLTVAVGPEGSGSAVTWDSFILGEPRYQKVPTVPLAGIRAIKKVVEGSEAACMVFTAGLNSGLMVNDAAPQGKFLKLVKVDDRDFDKMKDAKGKQLYEYLDIPGSTYKGVQDGVFSTSVSTVAVSALFVANAGFADKHGKAYDAILRAETKALPAIRKLVGQ